MSFFIIDKSITLGSMHDCYEDVKVEKRGGSQCPLNVPSMSPNKIDSRRIYENQKCDNEQFVKEKPLK